MPSRSEREFTLWVCPVDSRHVYSVRPRSIGLEPHCLACGRLGTVCEPVVVVPKETR
jgi:hypothetical protein